MPSSSSRDVAGSRASNPSHRYWILYAFIASYSVVHLRLEHDMLTTGGRGMFNKYLPPAAASSSIADGQQQRRELNAARWVYHSKAVWCFLLILLQGIGTLCSNNGKSLVVRIGRRCGSFRAALAISYAVYCVELAVVFGWWLQTSNVFYIGLNCFIGVLMLLETFVLKP